MSATPVVIGVGDIINRSSKVEDAIEPLQLIIKAVQNAIRDSGASDAAQRKLQLSIDSVDIVLPWTWPYSNLPGLVAQSLDLKPTHCETSPHGGNQPARLFDEAARRVSQRKCRVAVIAGGEALASLTSCAAKGKLPPPGWTPVDKNVDSVFSPTTRELGGDLGGIHSIGAPIQVYPLYENAFRAARNQSIQENNDESAQLYADFAEVASQNPMAWSYGKPPSTKIEIGTVSKKNRNICFPYPLLMNAFNNVNLAGACIITSTETAEQLEISKDRWIYPLGGAGTRDAYGFWERPNFYSSPSISQSLDAALKTSNISVNDIDLFDFYSCFPIVPKLACQHLGLPIIGGSKPITLLGGLTSFGGAGNNYSMHAIIEMVRRLRNGREKNGLILANGGTLTYQHVICISSSPRADGSGYPEQDMLPENLEHLPKPRVTRDAVGEVTIETYTIEYDRSGAPSMAYIVCRLKANDDRVLANEADGETLRELASSKVELIGRSGWMSKDPTTEGRGLFSFSDPRSKL
ncbi:hypothetical protein BT63DRAFT_421745 [Microthyrium microscopicum]|uniref:Thiolase-like protein type 1 additional C-terminal domain-containing protein n=1 Tax=Microthyrium microscopicum TaxID=703497 RepID=A0A6A6UMW6_9PEZI|nr:hypothetical protein BT63DRAFT_421745 [Microthyrium microscopicum]